MVDAIIDAGTIRAKPFIRADLQREQIVGQIRSL
jgi:hypothetical protein